MGEIEKGYVVAHNVKCLVKELDENHVRLLASRDTKHIEADIKANRGRRRSIGRRGRKGFKSDDTEMNALRNNAGQCTVDTIQQLEELQAIEYAPNSYDDA